MGLSSAVRAVLAKALDPGAAGLRAELDPIGQQLKQWLSERLDVLERRVDASATLDRVSRQHGVLEITRSGVSSTSEKLRSIGTPIDDSQLAVVAAEGGRCTSASSSRSWACTAR